MPKQVDDDVFLCVECSDEYETKSELDDHLMNTHNWTADEVKEGEKEYEVERVISHRMDKREKKVMYLVKWVGYDEPSEIGKENFDDDCPALKKYLKANEAKAELKSKRKSQATESKRAKSVTNAEKNVIEDVSTLEDVLEPEKKKRKRSPSSSAQPEDIEGNILSEEEFEKFKVGRSVVCVAGVCTRFEDKSSSLFYLVRFSRQKGDRKTDSNVFLPSDQVWRDYPEHARRFFEEMTIEQRKKQLGCSS